MAVSGDEAIGSMGNDSPSRCCRTRTRPSTIIQAAVRAVTNPPIDPIREELVTSLLSFIGPKPNLLGIDEMNPRFVSR